MGHGFPRIFGGAGELEGFGAVEGRCQAHFAGFFGVYLRVIVRGWRMEL